MAARAQSGDGVARPRAATAPAQAPVTFGEPGGTDELSVIVVPTATLEAVLALGKRLGGLPPTSVIMLALKRLLEDADSKGL